MTGRHRWAGRWQLAAADSSASERIDVRSPSWPSVFARSVLSLLIGMVAWFFAFLSGIAAFRGLFYGLITDGSYEYSWGGPAWAVPVALVLAAAGALLFRSWLHQA
ncbi:hypothetical protein R1CP_30060 [Rhodococcus opacus]|nr:hypothetical protein [Rhodococcus opacus]ANS30640.1 hypothetical protein R1CP_30060 [Rhodococcus opacus]